MSELEADVHGRPKGRVTIGGCGLLPALKEAYDLSEDDLDKDNDIRPGPVSPGEVEL